MPSPKITYDTAMQRLEQIVEELESGELELEKLTTELAEAQKLLKFCNDKLRQVEGDVQKILGDEQE